VLPLLSQSLLIWWEGRGGQQIMQRRTTGRAFVIPVLLHPVTFEASSLKPLQSTPRRGPVTAYRDQDDAFVEVARDVRGVLGEMRR
jgi:hypothetical protein